MTELGKHRLGRHSMADLDPGLNDYELAEALVREAGQLALLMREAGLEGQQKTSISDVVTAADHAAEAYVLEQLRRCRPDDGILGEEGASVTGTSGRMWVIDPVDGTYNFLHGSTYWCSAIALKDSSGRVAGRCLSAGGGQALGRRHGPGNDAQRGTSDQLRARGCRRFQQVRHAARGTRRRHLHPSHVACGPDVRHAVARSCDVAASLRMNGSGSCDLSRVADGQLGCWFQHSCPEWDWLPGKALVLAAGGQADVVRVNGLDWFLAGGTRAVRELRAALESGSVA